MLQQNDTLNEADIIKRITKNFSAPFKKGEESQKDGGGAGSARGTG